MTQKRKHEHDVAAFSDACVRMPMRGKSLTHPTNTVSVADGGPRQCTSEPCDVTQAHEHGYAGSSGLSRVEALQRLQSLVICSSELVLVTLDLDPARMGDRTNLLTFVVQYTVLPVKNGC